MSEIPKNIAVCILAAGESVRMGNVVKQLLPWGNTTLLGSAIQLAKSVEKTSEVIVVLGAFESEIKKALRSELENVTVLINKNWKYGMGESIGCLGNYLSQMEEVPGGVLMLLGDQPFIKISHLEKLIKAFNKGDKGIVATGMGKKAGVPAIFSSKYFPLLKGLKGKGGAQKIIRDNPEDVMIACIENRSLYDIDTMEEYRRHYRNSKKL